MKVDRPRILQYLRGCGHDDVDSARRAFPTQVGIDRDRANLIELVADPDHVLERLGEGHLGTLIGG